MATSEISRGKGLKLVSRTAMIGLGIVLGLIIIGFYIIPWLFPGGLTKPEPPVSMKERQAQEPWIILFFDAKGKRRHRSKAKVEEFENGTIKVSYTDYYGSQALMHGEKTGDRTYRGEVNAQSWSDGNFELTINKYGDNAAGHWWTPNSDKPEAVAGAKLQLIRQ